MMTLCLSRAALFLAPDGCEPSLHTQGSHSISGYTRSARSSEGKKLLAQSVFPSLQIPDSHGNPVITSLSLVVVLFLTFGVEGGKRLILNKELGYKTCLFPPSLRKQLKCFSARRAPVANNNIVCQMLPIRQNF